MKSTYDGSKAAIVGGSIGGLSAGLLLRDLGFEVDIYERTAEELDGRGGGIVLQPEMQRWFQERSSRRPEKLSTVATRLQYLDIANNIVFEEPTFWRATSWGTLYRALLGDFGRNRYHLGHSVTGVNLAPSRSRLQFANGRQTSADLVVFADGITSTGRKQLLPEVSLKYAGYVGWRGTVTESELTDATRSLLVDSFTYFIGPNTQICLYPIPGWNDELGDGQRLINYVWYRNVPDGQELGELLTDTTGLTGEVSVPPGKVQDRFVSEMKAAALKTLAPAAAEVVNSTEKPYLQVVYDCWVPKMVFGRSVILGDAGFVGRPHGAAGTAKVAAEAWGLAEALQTGSGDIDVALASWEPTALATGNRLVDRCVAMGRRSQFENTWDPNDTTLRFGLYEPLNPTT